MTADNGSICADGRAPFHDGLLVICPSLRILCPRCQVIGKNTGRAAEDTIFQNHAFINGYIVLKLAAVSDHRPAGHIYILSK